MIIKLILISGLTLAGLFAYRAGRGARSLALRRIGFLLAMALCIVAVRAEHVLLGRRRDRVRRHDFPSEGPAGTRRGT